MVLMEGEKNFTEVKWEGNNVLLFGSEGSGMHKHFKIWNYC